MAKRNTSWGERVRESRTVKIYTRLRYDVFWELYIHDAGAGSTLNISFLFHPGIILVFEVSESCTFKLFFTFQPGAVWPPWVCEDPGWRDFWYLPCSALCPLLWDQKLRHYIFFGHSLTLWLLFLPAFHPLNSSGISAVFSLLL